MDYPVLPSPTVTFFPTWAIQSWQLQRYNTHSVGGRSPVLQLGYFKAKRQFFAYETEKTAEDRIHILNQHFPSTDLDAIKTPSRPIQAQLHQPILRLFDYRHCKGEARLSPNNGRFARPG